MDLNLQTLIGLTYLAPIALTLRKVYAPDFELPDAFVYALAKIDPTTMNPQFVSHFKITPQASHATLG